MYDIHEFELDWSMFSYSGNSCQLGLHTGIKKMQTIPLVGQGVPKSYVQGRRHPNYHLCEFGRNPATIRYLNELFVILGVTTP